MGNPWFDHVKKFRASPAAKGLSPTEVFTEAKKTYHKGDNSSVGKKKRGGSSTVTPTATSVAAPTATSVQSAVTALKSAMHTATAATKGGRRKKGGKTRRTKKRSTKRGGKKGSRTKKSRK